MRKTKKTTKTILEELERTGLVSSACTKAQIPRSTYYRWYKSDIDFRFAADAAIEIGRSNMTDFAESVVLKNIQNGNQRAAEFFLRSNDDRYRSSYARDFQNSKEQMVHKYEKDLESLKTFRAAIFKSLPTELLEKLLYPAPRTASEEYEITHKEANERVIEREIQRFVGSHYYQNLMDKLLQVDDIAEIIRQKDASENKSTPTPES